MTHHDFITRMDAKNVPYLVCRVCGTTYPAETPLETVNASACVKVKRYDILDTRHILPSSKADPLYERLPMHELKRVDVEGARLLDAWRKERGEG